MKLICCFSRGVVVVGGLSSPIILPASQNPNHQPIRLYFTPAAWQKVQKLPRIAKT